MKDLMVEKQRNKKLDWIIYTLAVISLGLMIAVIVANHKNSLKIESSSGQDYTTMVRKQEVDKKELPSIAETKKEEKVVLDDSKKVTESENNTEKKELNATEADKKSEISDVITSKKTEISKVKKEVSTVTDTDNKKIETIVNKKTEPAQKKLIEKKDVKPIVKKQIEVKKEIIVNRKSIRFSKYNWKTLNRYRMKPSKGLSIKTKYRVKTGDALWKIAKKFGIKNINIIAVNSNINNPDHIYPGQMIVIPNR